MHSRSTQTFPKQAFEFSPPVELPEPAFADLQGVARRRIVVPGSLPWESRLWGTAHEGESVLPSQTGSRTRPRDPNRPWSSTPSLLPRDTEVGGGWRQA